MHATLPLMQVTDFPAIHRGSLATLQVNLGYKCNQSCVHCHVNAGPHRTEQMDHETVEAVLAFIETARVRTLDLTGGAPELNPYFRDLVVQAKRLGAHVMDRCNLTILEQPGQTDLACFLARNDEVLGQVYRGDLYRGKCPGRQWRKGHGTRRSSTCRW